MEDAELAVHPVGGDEALDLLQIFGRANPFKEGDERIGVAARNDAERLAARAALRGLRVGELRSARFVDDEVSELLDAAVDCAAAARVAEWTVGELASFLLSCPEPEVRRVTPGLSSEAIAGVVKLLSDAELSTLCARIFNPPMGSTLGARGYLGSRIQPNSATDDPNEVLFSVLEGLSYGCGDVLLGINPVDGDCRNVARLQRALREVVSTFELGEATTYCVLAHIDEQLAAHDAEAARGGGADCGADSGADGGADGGGADDGADGGGADAPPPVACGFAPLGGTTAVHRTFGVDMRALLAHLERLHAQYFETGQGSEVTNGCAHGVDMVTLEARAHGVARALALRTRNWTIVNDVSGFIGPEVFGSAEQLQRACLEDLCMGKLHGLTMGLDVCATMHMAVTLHELDTVTDALVRARPAFLMAVAGKADPMLSYITTSFRDHARLRLRHELRVSDAMAPFFERVGVMVADGLGRTMTARAGDVRHLYAQLLRARGDARADKALREEADAIVRRLQARGLDLGRGHDGSFDAPPSMHAALALSLDDARRVVALDLSPDYCARAAKRGALLLDSRAPCRSVYVREPQLGEALDDDALAALRAHASARAPRTGYRVALLLSDGLNAEAVEGIAALRFETGLRAQLTARALPCDPTLYVVRRGRVRVGYQVGRELFAHEAGAQPLPAGAPAGARDAAPAAAAEFAHGDDARELCATVHILGERPGNGKNSFSAYVAIACRSLWAEGVNHDSAKVVACISAAATLPAVAVEQVLAILVAGLRPCTARAAGRGCALRADSETAGRLRSCAGGTAH